MPEANEPSAVMRRYRDAYLVARATVGVGDLIKLCSVLLGAVVAVGAVMVSVQLETYAGVAVLGIVLGLILGGIGYVLGLLVAAQGQILKATLDTSVNTSPFLVNAHRAKVMSLRILQDSGASVPEDIVDDGPDEEEGEPMEHCYYCGADLPKESRVSSCPRCGNRL